MCPCVAVSVYLSQDLGDSFAVFQPVLLTFPRRPPDQIGNDTEHLNTHADARSVRIMMMIHVASHDMT